MGDYPEEYELEKITQWKVTDVASFHLLMGYIETLWHWESMFKFDNKVYTLITGGWSGNEDIIRAMQENTMFWLMYWESSKRGGRYTFCDIKTSIDVS